MTAGLDVGYRGDGWQHVGRPSGGLVERRVLLLGEAEYLFVGFAVCFFDFGGFVYFGALLCF